MSSLYKQGKYIMILLFAAILLAPLISVIIAILTEESKNYTGVKWDNATMENIAYPTENSASISSPPKSLHSPSSPVAKTLVSIKAITDKLTEHQSEIDARLFAKAKSLSSNVAELMSLYNMTDDKDLQGEVLQQLLIINDTLADDLDAAKLPGTDSYVMEKLKINKIYLDSAKNS